MATHTSSLNIRISHGLIEATRVWIWANEPSGDHVVCKALAYDRDFVSAAGHDRFYSKQHFGVPEKNHEIN